MDAILNGLNAAQRSAVTSPASVLQILAPPGSGKTKTLTSRVAYLLSHHGYQPWDIICLTFTIKSAKEMRERIEKLIGNGTEKKLVLGTFHSVCRRYLVRYGHLIGLRKGFGIADSADSIAIVNRVVKRLKLNIDSKTARARISSAKARNISLAQLGGATTKQKSMDQQEFFKVYEAYESHLAISNLLDYDDLLLRCVDLLKQHPNCVGNVQATLIDEFQDTSIVQFELMQLFASSKNRITTVGDPDQSIYGWRSAEVKNLKRMKRQYPDTLVMHLEDNYRSSGTILLAALEVIEQDESRPPKPLLPTHCPGTMPVLRHLPTSAAEADWIVSETKRLVGLTGHLLNLSDFVILLRSASLSRQIESAMGKAGIPYRMVGGQRFFDRVEVKLLLDYLQVISQPDNSDALARVINVPSRRIGEATVKGLLDEGSERQLSLWNLARGIVQGQLPSKIKLSKPAERGLCNLINIITTCRSKLSSSEFRSPRQVLEYIVEKLHFQQHLKDTYFEDYEGRWANVEELMSQAVDCADNIVDLTFENRDEDGLPSIEGLSQFTADGPEENLSKFLANVALSTELERQDELGEVAQERLTISTIHAAKGLEWPVVFIPSTYEGSIPHSRAEDTDEERRLLYVAMTRAQALLYMSCPKKNSLREDTRLSPFLSTPKVAPYLTNKGPTFSISALTDIANILRRDMPSQATMEQYRDEVKNLEDDIWPLTGEEADEAIQSRWNGTSEPKLPTARFSSISNTFNRLSNHQPSFTTSPFPLPTSGFITASSRLQEIEAGPKTKKLKSDTVQRRSAKSQGTPALRSQESLLKMWGSKAKDSLSVLDNLQSEVHFPQPIQAVTSTTDVSSSAVLISSDTFNAARSTTGIPESLADHVLQPLTKGTRPRLPHEPRTSNTKTYTFLSSSPTRAESAPAKTVEAVEIPRLKSTTEIPNTVSSISKSTRLLEPASVEAFNHSPGVLQDQRPCSTLHTTTMSTIQNASLAPSKTLGVRRSLNGWQARSNHTPFNPPKRKIPP